MLLWPMIGLVMCILQLVIIQYTQVLLNDALYTSAANPEPELLVNNAALYKTRVCTKIRTMPSATCLSTLVLQMGLLQSYSTTAAAISASSFSSGVSGDVIILRAALPPTRFIPLLPYWTAKSSVVLRR